MELESLAVVSCLPLAPLDPQPGFRWDVGFFVSTIAADLRLLWVLSRPI